MTKSKYDSFPMKDKAEMDILLQKDPERISKQNSNIDNPNNPAHTIDAVIMSIYQ